MKNKWKISLVCNTLVMCVFALASAATQIRLHNALQYDELGCRRLPPLSSFVLHAEWLLIAVPVSWIIAGLILLFFNWKREDSPQDMIQLHTSITLLAGITMLVVFAIGGILPFVSISVSLSQ
jgi:hypothetical protein